MGPVNLSEILNRDFDNYSGNETPIQPESISELPNEKKVPFIKPFIEKKEQIEKLQSINGLSISEIQERARPGRYSLTGFIGEAESFKEVLRKDWETVERLHITHAELAAHLANIISLAESAKRNSQRSFKDSLIIEYRTSDLENSSIASELPQKLEVVLMGTKGLQDDLFEPEHDHQREVQTPKGWNEENIVINPAMGIKLHLNSGILSYIHEFGFYEGGGDQNRYRVDPLKVMALLTGKSLEELNRL